MRGVADSVHKVDWSYEDPLHSHAQASEDLGSLLEKRELFHGTVRHIQCQRGFVDTETVNLAQLERPPTLRGSVSTLSIMFQLIARTDSSLRPGLVTMMVIEPRSPPWLSMGLSSRAAPVHTTRLRTNGTNLLRASSRSIRIKDPKLLEYAAFLDQNHRASAWEADRTWRNSHRRTSPRLRHDMARNMKKCQTVHGFNVGVVNINRDHRTWQCGIHVAS